MDKNGLWNCIPDQDAVYMFIYIYMCTNTFLRICRLAGTICPILVLERGSSTLGGLSSSWYYTLACPSRGDVRGKGDLVLLILMCFQHVASPLLTSHCQNVSHIKTRVKERQLPLLCRWESQIIWLSHCPWWNLYKMKLFRDASLFYCFLSCRKLNFVEFLTVALRKGALPLTRLCCMVICF